MGNVVFNDLANDLKIGREIEFSYKSKNYSITNCDGFWIVFNDSDSTLLETVCRFEEKEVLVSKIAAFVIDDVTIQQIFDRQLYDLDKLVIL